MTQTPQANQREAAFALEVLLQALRGAFEADCAARGVDPVATLAGVIEPGRDPGDFWDLAREAIESGEIHLIFVGDPRSPACERMADFLNGQMDPSGVASQLLAGRPTLDPLADLARALRVWDEKAFFRELTAGRGHEEAAIASALLSWARDRGLAIRWEGDQARGGFTPWLEVRGERYTTATVWTDGSIDVDLEGLRTTSLFSAPATSLEMTALLDQIWPSDRETRPALARLMAEPGAFERFLGALDRVVDTVLASR